MKIVILDCHAVNPGDLSWEPIKEIAECVIYERTSQEQVIERAKDADGFLSIRLILPVKYSIKLPQLKYIGELATGYNNIDVEVARERGIVVCNIPCI